MIETRILFDAGDLVLATQSAGDGKQLQRLTWAEKGKAAVILFETGQSTSRGPYLSLCAAYRDEGRIGVVLGNGLGGADYVCFQMQGERWHETDRAILGAIPVDSNGVQMTSVTRFEWLRENKPADHFEITSELRAPGTNYRHVKKNGKAYVPEGTHFTVELPPLVSAAPMPSKNPTTESLARGEEPVPPTSSIKRSPVALPPAASKPAGGTAWLLWLSVVVAAAIGTLWIIARKS